MRSQENVRNLLIWTASLCKNNPQILVKSTNRDENLNRCSGYISIPNLMPLPPGISRKCPKTLKLTRFTKFFGLCDLENWHMTLKIRAPQAAGISNYLITYQDNRWWNVLAKVGTDGRTDKSFMDMLAAAKNATHYTPWHRISDQKIEERRNKLCKIPNGTWAYIVLRRCQTNVLHSDHLKIIYLSRKFIFKWSEEMGVFSISKI